MDVASTRRLQDGTPPSASGAAVRGLATDTVEEVLLARRLTKPAGDAGFPRVPQARPRLAPVRHAAPLAPTASRTPEGHAQAARETRALDAAARRLSQRITKLERELATEQR